MKLPWKILSGFRSRRNPARTEDNPIDADTNTGAVEKETLRVKIVIGNALVGSPAALRDQSPAIDLFATTAIPERGLKQRPSLRSLAAVEDSREAVLENGEEKDVEAASSLHQDKNRVDLFETPVIDPPRGFKRSIKPDGRGAIATDAYRGVEGLPPSKGPAPENTLSLDDQIKLLRNQLALKLHQQNVHLRKMLERFDRS